MKSWYQLYRNVFTKKQCAELISYALKLKAREGVVGHGGKAKKDDMRRSTVRWISGGDNRVSNYTSVIRNLLHRANVDCFGFDYRDFSDLQFTEYNSDVEGHYDWHEDLSWIQGPESPIFDRKLSLVVQLSDPESYEGGQLELDPSRTDFNKIEDFSPLGSVVVFPSFLFHRVSPITEGVRYSLVTWAQGPRFQ